MLVEPFHARRDYRRPLGFPGAGELRLTLLPAEALGASSDEASGLVVGLA